jgi:ABC-2 type transport system ATP-binding protein
VESRLNQTGIHVDAARCIEPGLEDVFVGLLSRRTQSRPVPEIPPVTTASIDEPAIEVEGLTRRFGHFVAVDDAAFTVKRGEIFGFLGPNGSGKSTTIRMLTGILKPSAGTARVDGLDIRRDGLRIRPRVGYMSQKFSLYDDLTANENLDFFAGVYGVPRRERRARKDWALSVVGLPERRGSRVRDLSGGWKQRLALAAAIMHHPSVLLLDEPTSGVDPLSRRQFWDLIFEFSAAGVTVLVTTHYMDEAERCQRVAFLRSGRIRAVGEPATLRRKVRGRMLEVGVSDPITALRTARAILGVRQATLYGSDLHVLVDDGADARLEHGLRAAGHGIRSVTPVPLTMEDIFLALVGDVNGAAGADEPPAGGAATRDRRS